MSQENIDPESVAYLGPRASYTHEAALNTFPERRLLSCSSIENVFIAVQTRAAAIGVVPFENSTNGPVVFTLDLFADRDLRFVDIQVCGETFVDVHHCLLGRARSPSRSLASLANLSIPSASGSSTPEPTGSATPTSTTPTPKEPATRPVYSIEHIQRVYTHPMALGQCRAFLSTYLRQAEQYETTSTSRAAEFVADQLDEDDTAAAIACELASQEYGLQILARNIEDEVGNRTRFLVLRHCMTTLPGPGNDTAMSTREPTYKTLISFTVSHSSPGALADSLAVFRNHGLNLTSINSRPSREAPWHYIFFVEVLGIGYAGRPDQDDMAAALADLAAVASGWRWLGSWDLE
ncbi:MAG: prephenate dehydratase [Bogoriella megaspora]|nr:MAG: prephenate dehydratase [Bogoriella megaspora]